MKTVQAYQVDAFTDRPFGGNPAGVILGADLLTEAQMQRLAREMNCSETAFVCRPDCEGADFRVRFFTPACEVPLCGHATIATFHVLASEGIIPRSTPRVHQFTGAGLLPVDLEWGDNGPKIMMTQAPPQFRPFAGDPEPVVRALGLEMHDVDPQAPIEFASTGLWDLMVPLTGLDAMRRIDPDHAALAALNRSQNAVSTHVWTAETADPAHDFHTRNLAAACGIPEDPVTGTANGALGAYLVSHGILKPERCNCIRVEQGYEIDRPGLVHVEIAAREGTIERVRVGGRAVVVLKGEMRVE